MVTQTNTLHTSWTNLILHATSAIAERKNRLQTAHSLAGVILVIQLIAAELWLTVISLPLYLVTKNVGDISAGTGQYKVRRVITLSMLSSILVIWIIKLIIILLFVFVVDPRQSFQVQETNSKIEQGATITTSIPKASIDSGLPVPKILAAKGTQGSVAIIGEARPNEAVVAILQEANSTDSENPPGLYSGHADNTGRFAITEDEGVFHLPVGDYVVSTVAYDEARDVKSQTSSGLRFSVAEHPVRHALGFLDQTLNVLALIFILIGLGMTILTL